LAEAASDRTRVRRHPERGVYDPAAIHAIVDEAPICHVGFVHEGQPFVLPTTHGRRGDTLYLHGAVASTMLRGLARGLPVCVTFTLLDGLVLARSIYNHSMNYRSVVAVGTAVDVRGREEKLQALEAITEHVMPGRWQDARQPSEPELKATRVLRLSLIEASAKVREGPPVDDEEDMSLPVWAGVVPVAIRLGAPEAAPEMAHGTAAPAYVAARVAAAAVR
jgi:nitroimidazol reductase NimA-like FMN-containing flavoprotein (pyridoxamine 5'-phosphate oxidase superfamily)